MVTQEEKLIVLLKHQPYITMFDINEYVEMYDEKGKWYHPCSVPYEEDNGKLRRYTFTEFVDFMMAPEEDYE